MEAQLSIDQALHENFGFKAFRTGQRELIEAVLAGRDALGVLPTGGGKSLTYQLPALLLDGLTVVISPLIALMKDQVDAFNKRNKGLALAMHSNQSGREISESYESLRNGEVAMLYVAPERLVSQQFSDFLVELKPKLLVIDEAHCVSMWGHDFRPSYLSLGRFAEVMRPCPILALTATATPTARRDIAHRLGLKNHLDVTGSFDRPNLSFDVYGCTADEKKEALKELLGKGPEAGTQIVYVGRRADVEELVPFLNHEGYRAVGYHAGMTPNQRKHAQDSWLSDEHPIAVATVAFGMGIDKPDVRTVIHYQHPSSLESYYQEAGRAGRDGNPARCVLLFSGKDSSLAHFFIRNRYPEPSDVREFLQAIQSDGTTGEELSSIGSSDMTPEKRNVALLTLMESKLVWQNENGLYERSPVIPKYIPMDGMMKRRDTDYRRLETMLDYARSSHCHRAVLLNYFGENLPTNHRCGNCSACNHKALTHATTPPKKKSPPKNSRDHAQVHEQTQDYAAPRKNELTGLPRAKVVVEISRLLLLHQEIFLTEKVKMLRAVTCFMHGSESKALPQKWRELEGYGALDHVKQKELESLTRETLIKLEIWKPKEQIVYPKLEAIKASGDVFWQSNRRAFTRTELNARQVARERGLLILQAFAAESDGLPPGRMAMILLGHGLTAKEHPELMEHPFWKKADGGENGYDDMLIDVLAMWCKGYLEPSESSTRKLVVTNRGRAVLSSKK